MADEGESQTDVLARIREQGSAFEHMTDRTDEKINDGSNYAGLMRPEDYKKKRVEVTMTEEEVRAKKVAAATARINADREAARPVPQGEPWMVARYHAEVPTDRTDDTCVATDIVVSNGGWGQLSSKFVAETADVALGGLHEVDRRHVGDRLAVRVEQQVQRDALGVIMVHERMKGYG